MEEVNGEEKSKVANITSITKEMESGWFTHFGTIKSMPASYSKRIIVSSNKINTLFSEIRGKSETKGLFIVGRILHVSCILNGNEIKGINVTTYLKNCIFYLKEIIFIDELTILLSFNN